ncbi:hypothetical protein CLG96_07745 [Sphingomonas oleivorans]|uniref:Peptidase n=1 Tax=Sphingomonas oleivorans TaxID=1735121 RepID=A0A2T5FZ21_9SPHN|nr:PepSY-associated TM helix domain-containing protein [Sphingomonas oleivorans]PTQ11811.1 hypothetical protein CLG96_07745 [Sphingomonas oleivorans]
MSPRKLVHKLHLYGGLAVLIPLMLIMVTGAILLFDDEIDRALNPELFYVSPQRSPLPLSELMASVRVYRPDLAVRVVTLPVSADRALKLHSTDGIDMFVDPYTGDLLGQRSRARSFVGIITNLHMYFLLGEAWAVAAGTVALLAVGMGLTGIFLWWPRGRLSRALRLPLRGPPRAFIYNAHRTIGFYVSAILILVGITGASIAFPSQRRAIIEGLTGERFSTVPPILGRGGQGSTDLDAILAAARHAVPHAIPRQIRLQQGGLAPVRVRARGPGDPFVNGWTMIYLHPTSHRVLSVEEPTSAGRIMESWLLHLHLGYWGGIWGEGGSIATRLIWLASMIAALGVTFTGPAIWWIKRRSRRSNLKAARQRHSARSLARP